MNGKLISRGIIIIICVIGCILQLYTLTEEYFRMEVVKHLTLKPPKSVQIPDVTFSAPATQFINFSKLMEKFPSKANLLNAGYGINITNYRKMARTNRGYSIKEALSTSFTTEDLLSVIYDPKELIKIVDIPSLDNGFPTEDTSVCSQNVYLKYEHIFATTSCYSKKENKFSANDLFQNYFSGTLITFRINDELFDDIGSLTLNIHTPKTLIHGIRTAAVNLDSTSPVKYYEITYRRTYTALLKSPYESDCWDYTEHGYDSRAQSVEECENKMSMEKLGLVFPENIQRPESPAFMDPNKYEQLKRNPISREIREKCDKKNTHLDCVNEVFIPVSDPGENMALTFTMIAVKVTRDLEVIKKTRPKTSFVEYITLALSVVGTWFGWSLIGIVGGAVSMAMNKKLYNDLKEKKLSIGRKNNKNRVGDGGESGEELKTLKTSKSNALRVTVRE